MKRVIQFRLVTYTAVVLLAATGGIAVQAQEKIGPPPSEQKQPIQIKPAPLMQLRDVLRQTYLYNPTLNAARAQLIATQERLPQAQAGWKPTVNSNAAITASDSEGSAFGSGNATTKDLGVSLSQPIYRGGRTMAQTAAARATIAAQTSQVSALEQDILRQAVTAYMDVLRDYGLLELRKNNLEVIARQLKATQDRFDVGELTRTDVSQAEARRARADADVTTALGNLNSTRAVFEEIVGLRAMPMVQPDIDLPLPQTVEDAIAQAEGESPIVLTATHVHHASEEDVDGVFGELLPEVGLSSYWNKSYDPAPGLVDDQTTKAIGLVATIPLYEAGATRSRVRQAKHTANQRYIEIQEARRQVRQTAVTSWADLQAAQAEIRSRQAQVDASTVAQEGVRAENEYGTRTVLDLLDANQELLDAQVALLIAQRNETVAKFSLLSVLGDLSPETLGFPEDTINYDANLASIQHKIFDMNVDRVQETP
jgi:outer membrane protein